MKISGHENIVTTNDPALWKWLKDRFGVDVEDVSVYADITIEIKQGKPAQMMLVFDVSVEDLKELMA